jgi:hypothetical protein
VVLRQELRRLAERWRRECEEARAETERTNARLLAGKTLTVTSSTGPPPLGKEQAASELAEVLDRYPFGGMEGHGEACYYCGEECNSLAGNPGRWPIPLTHPDEPGVVKWHHIRCVSERLSDDKISR